MYINTNHVQSQLHVVIFHDLKFLQYQDIVDAMNKGKHHHDERDLRYTIYVTYNINTYNNSTYNTTYDTQYTTGITHPYENINICIWNILWKYGGGQQPDRAER